MFDNSPSPDARFLKARRSLVPAAPWRFSLGTLFLVVTAFGFVMFVMRMTSRQVWVDLATWVAAALTAQAGVWLVGRWTRPEIKLWGTVCVVGVALCSLLALTAGLSVLHPVGFTRSELLWHYLAWLKLFGAAAVLGMAIGGLASLGRGPHRKGLPH
jgi:hypothetical protein